MRPRDHAALILSAAVRTASAWAFAAQVVAILAMSGLLARWGWCDLGLRGRFWTKLAAWNAALALICLIPGLILVGDWQARRGQEPARDVRWCVLLDLATIVSVLMVPALAAKS